MSAGGRWFRVNTMWSHSEWLAVLPPAARLAWIELLGLACDLGVSAFQPPPIHIMALEFRISRDDVLDMLLGAMRSGAVIYASPEETGGDPWITITDPGAYGLPAHNTTQRLPAHEWALVRAEVFERDDYTCRYCHKRGGLLECDHVFPLSRGGGNETSNLVTACRRCNRSKRDKTLTEWARL